MAIAVSTSVSPMIFPPASASTFAQRTGSRNPATIRRNGLLRSRVVVISLLPFLLNPPLDDVLLAGPDVVADVHGQHEDTSVADFAGARRLNDCFDDFLDHIVRHDHFDLHLRQQTDGVLL